MIYIFTKRTIIHNNVLYLHRERFCSSTNFVCPSLFVLKVSLFDVYFRSRISISCTPRGQPISSVYLAKKFFHRGGEQRSDESSSPSAPFSRSPPLASNFNYTLLIGGTAGGRGRGRSKGGKQEGPGTKRVARCSANISR